jgi:hypothetical protein
MYGLNSYCSGSDQYGHQGVPGGHPPFQAIFGICLIIRFKIKQIALGAAILTFIFGLCMAGFIGVMAPFNYPVFVFTGADLVLSGLGYYKWSIDDYLQTNRTK